MILTTEKTEIQNLGFEEGTSFKIKPEFLGKIFNILSGFYSDVYGSPLRELLNNAWDAELEAGVENPSPKIKYENGVFTISDKGTGMSKHFMLNRYISAGDSTKNGSNSFIGGFGVGKLAILSYLKQIQETQYNLETVVDGVKYYYVIYKKDEIPNVNLLYEEETNEPNGTSVSFSVPTNYHLVKFKEAIKNQLRFFDGIQIEGIDVELIPFLKRENYCIDFNKYSYNAPYCVVGKNIYKINTDKFSEMSEGNILLYFNVGDVDLVENREELKYTDKTISALRDKYNAAKKDLETIYKEQNSEITNTLEWIDKLKDTYGSIVLNEKEISLKQFKIYSTPILKGYDNKILTAYSMKTLGAFINLFYRYKSVRGNYNIIIKDCVVIEQDKGFTTYKLSYNNKKHIINLNEYFDIRILQEYTPTQTFYKENREEFLKFEKQFRKELLEQCLHAFQLRSPITYSKSNLLKASKEEIKYTYFNRHNSKKKGVMNIGFFINNHHKYLIFTDEKYFLQNINTDKYFATKDCKMKTRIYLSANEYKKLIKNNVKHILYSDFIKTEEYTNALVRAKIKDFGSMMYPYLNKTEKRICYELKALFDIEDKINLLKKMKNGLEITTSYNVEQLKHPHLELLNRHAELKDELHNQLQWLRQSRELYLKYCLLQKKLKKCQLKLYKSVTI